MTTFILQFNNAGGFKTRYSTNTLEKSRASKEIISWLIKHGAAEIVEDDKDVFEIGGGHFEAMVEEMLQESNTSWVVIKWHDKRIIDKSMPFSTFEAALAHLLDCRKNNGDEIHFSIAEI